MKKTRNFNIYFTFITILTFILSFGLTIVIGLLIIFILNKVSPNFNLSPHIIMFISLLSSSFLGCMTSCYINKKVVKRTSEINNSLNKAMLGDFTSYIELPKKNTMFYDLVFNFNKLLKELNSNQLLKEDFVSNFSHEFKTPIVSIKGYAELLAEDDSIKEEDKQKYLNVIIEESKRLVSLSKQTMLLCKLDNDEIIIGRERFNLKRQLEECVLLLDNQLKEKNITVDFKLNDIDFYTNKNMLKEVWINIINNSIKYSNDSGHIDISSYIDDKIISISIRDNGVGMDDEDTIHIFDRYYQADKSHNSKGIGLGLTIAKRIVELNDGKIDVASVKGKGTVFTITFSKQDMDKCIDLN